MKLKDENELTQAICVEEVITKRSLKSVYQPIVYHNENVVYAYEVLSRPRFRGTLMPPEDWFHAASKMNRAVQADLLAISSGIEQLELVTRSAPFHLFVNVMPSSLIQRGFIDGLERILQETHYNPGNLVVEIVEYDSFDLQTLVEHIQNLQLLGVRIALDDFGQGTSSLQALVEIEPDFIKIDRSLIKGIAESERKQRLLSLLVKYMKTGDMVITEGIENSEDLMVVKEVGAGLSQGYYWGHPMPTEEVSLLTQIEFERNVLVNTVREKNGLFTDSEVMQKSQELDSLVARYYSLKKDR